MSDRKFSSLSLQPAILDNLSSLGYHEMTEIQAKSLPAILAGQDVIAQGKTGSGKTAAFGPVSYTHLTLPTSDLV